MTLDGPPTPDHQARLDAVMEVVRATGAARMLDAGCGRGDLLERLAHAPRVAQVLGIDVDLARVREARARMASVTDRVQVRAGSIIDAAGALAAFRPDMVILAEVIEHFEPSELAGLEQALFSQARPRFTLITTPNADYNSRLGVPPTRFRHPDHRLEWTRAQFADWARRLAARRDVRVRLADIVRPQPDVGGSSQMALFIRKDRGGQP